MMTLSTITLIFLLLFPLPLLPSLLSPPLSPHPLLLSLYPHRVELPGQGDMYTGLSNWKFTVKYRSYTHWGEYCGMLIIAIIDFLFTS